MPAVACARCLLHHDPPRVTVDEGSVCSLCRLHEAGRAGQAVLESDLTALLSRRCGPDAAPPVAVCSGNRSSVLALALAVRRYRLRPRVLLLDHGFLEPRAIENVQEAVRRLGLSLHHHREPAMRTLFTAASTGSEPVPICTLCTRWSRRRAEAHARELGAGVVLWGGGGARLVRAGEGGVDPDPYASLWESQGDAFVRAHPALARALALGPRRGWWPLRRAGPTHLGLPWLGPQQGRAEAQAAALEELGWRPLEPTYPLGLGGDCRLNLLAVERSMARYGLSHYHLELSRSVRRGDLTRAEAQALVGVELGAEPFRAGIAQGLACLGMSPDAPSG